MKINRFNIYVKLLCILFFLQEWNSASAALPDKVVYLYNQAVKTEDISAIMEKISDGDYTDTIALGATKVMKSAWIYLPGEVLRKDTLRNFLLIGHFESTDLYKNVNGHWEKVSSAGVYLKFSEENSSTGRYFFKLFDNSDEIADAYLVACRRFDDYVYSQIHGIPMTEAEVKNWKLEYDQTKEWFNRMTLPFWGVLLLTTILLAARYFSSRDKAYLMYAVGNSFFTANCVLLYFVDPCNIQYLPVDDPMIAVAVTGPVFVMGVGFFIFSFRYFYDKKQLEKLARQIPLWSLIACLVVSVFNTFLVYHYKILFVANIIMYTFLVVLIIIIYLVMFYHRKYAQGFPITTSFLTILYGSVFIALASIVGFVLSAVYAQNSLSLGKFHLMSFPLLIGIAIYNAFVLVAFSKRDHQISEEAHDLKIRAYEYEMRALQNGLNPHFIFNSLNLIDFFVYRKDLPQARNVLFQFSDLLRMVIDRTTEKNITLTEELKMLELYLKLECSRNMDSITYDIHVSEKIETDRIFLPPLLIQPIAENAIKHGILNREEKGGKVSIELEQLDDVLHIRVMDNGVGFKKSSELTSIIQNKRKHLGLELTRRRIELISDQASLEIQDPSDGEGTIVLIKIPI